jgi:hypothetical protein
MHGGLAVAAWVPILFAAPPVRIESSATCPDKAQISAELGRMLSSRDDAVPPSESANVAVHDQTLLVTLKGADGLVLGERRLLAEGDCDAQARAVAVIIATFLTDIHPEYLSLLPDSERQPDVAPAPSASAEGAEPPPLKAPPPPPPPPSPPSPPRTLPLAPPSPVSPEPSEWLVALAAGAEFSSEFVPAAALSLSFLPAAEGFGARAFVLVSGAAERQLGEELASSFRFPLGVGALFRFGRGSAWCDLSAGASVGWLHVAGRTFDDNESANDIVFGPFLGVRAGTEWLGLRPFAELGALAWPGESTLVARSPDATARLPWFEAFLLVGAGFVP